MSFILSNFFIDTVLFYLNEEFLMGNRIGVILVILTCIKTFYYDYECFWVLPETPSSVVSSFVEET